MTGSRRWSTILGLALLLVYVLPLLAPPAATVPVPAAADATFLERVFPGVPAWWVVGRLVCLLAGALLLAANARGPLPLTLDTPVSGADTRKAIRPGAERLALLIAGVHAAAGFFAGRFSRLAETVYFAFLAAPAAIMAWGESARLRPRLRVWAAPAGLLLILPALWMAVCLPLAWRAPRAANLVDMWVLIDRLEHVVVRGEQRLLADSSQPGHTNAYMMLEGAPLLGPGGVALTFTWLQTVHAIAAALCAAATGAAVWQMVGPAAAPVAQAALLFSPYGFSALYEPAPMFFTALCTSVLLLLVVLVRRFHSMAALVAFGAVAGLSSTDPPVVLIALLLCGLMLVSLRRIAPFPWRALTVGILSGAAAVTPSLPTPAMFMQMVQQYTLGRGQLVAVVRILYGQETPYTVATALRIGQAGPLDLPVGSLLAPWAIARTPLRIWGDVLFEPIAAVFMAIGLLVVAAHARRNRTALFFIVLLLAGLIGGFTAEGDAVSHTRLAPALIPIAVLTAVGFEAVRRSLAPDWPAQRIGAAAAALVAMSGLVLFEIVTPAIEPSSWLATSLEALDGSGPHPEAVFLTYDEPRNPKPGEPWNLRWLFVEPIARLLALPGAATHTVTDLDAADVADPPRLYLWSPALEADADISRRICERWPEATLYTLWDRPRIFPAYAATTRAGSWQPPLPRFRWESMPCAVRSLKIPPQ